MFILVTAFYATPVWLQTEVFKMENQQKKKKKSQSSVLVLPRRLYPPICMFKLYLM